MSRWHRLVRPALLLVAAATVLALMVAGVVTGAAASLLAPRVWPRTLGAVAVLFILSSVEFAASRHNGSAAAVPRLWPVILPLVLLPAALSGTSTDQATIRLFTAGGSRAPLHRAASVPPARVGTDGGWVGEANPALEAAGATLAQDTPFTRPDEERRATELSELAGAEGTLVIPDDAFAEWVDLIWDAPEAFAGREVELTVFAFRADSWSADQFAAARLSIWCCAADAAVVGLLVETNPTTAPPTGTWMQLRGTLDVRDSFDTGSITMEHLPVVTEISWRRIEAPAMEYVFPPAW